MRCTKHNVPHCFRDPCVRERRDRQSAASPSSSSANDPLSDPTSLTHQTVYGGAFYGAVDTTPAPSPSTDCGGGW